MQVYRIEDEGGTLQKLEFRGESGDNFKAAIVTWIQINYPATTWLDFFQRLESFDHDRCRVDMT